LQLLHTQLQAESLLKHSQMQKYQLQWKSIQSLVASLSYQMENGLALEESISVANGHNSPPREDASIGSQRVNRPETSHKESPWRSNSTSSQIGEDVVNASSSPNAPGRRITITPSRIKASGSSLSSASPFENDMDRLQAAAEAGTAKASTSHKEEEVDDGRTHDTLTTYMEDESLDRAPTG